MTRDLDLNFAVNLFTTYQNAKEIRRSRFGRSRGRGYICVWVGRYSLIVEYWNHSGEWK